MNIPAWASVFIVAMLAVFLFHHARAGIAGKANPHAMADYVAVALGVLLVMAMVSYEQHPSKAGGSEPLERLNVCSTPSNLAGCAGYSPGVVDPTRNDPVTGVPEIRPTPPWAANPGGPP